MRNNKKILTMSIAVLFSSNVYSIPNGFEDLYEEHVDKIKFAINDTDVIELKSRYSSENVTIDKSEIEHLKKGLENSYLNDIAKKRIILDLTNGVQSSTNCKGKRDVCVPEDDKNISYIVVQDEKLVRVLTPISYLDKNKRKKRYISITNKNKALISHHDLSFDMYDTGDSNYYYRNTSFLGLGPGFISGDFDLSKKTNDDFELNELAYNFLSGSTRVRFGYASDYIKQNWNATELLESNENKNVFGLTIGSTRQLEFKNKDTTQRIFFNSPANGRLTIYRNDKPILEKNISAGQNYLKLSELPQGIYNIDIKVKNGDKVVFNEKRTIFNKSKYNLNKGDLDYSVTVGNYENKEVYKNLDYGFSDDLEYKDHAMMDGKIAYKIDDGIIIGSEIGILESDSFYKFALDYQITNDLNINSAVNLFSNNSTYYQFGGEYKNLDIQISNYNDQHSISEAPKIDNYFYGIGDNKQLSVSYSRNIFSGNAYISYINQKNSKGNYFNKINLYNIGYSTPIFHDSSLAINYSSVENESNFDTNNDWSVDVSLDIPIGGYDSMRYSGNFDRKGNSNRIAYDHHIDLNDDIDGNIEAGVKYDNYDFTSDNEIADTSLSLKQRSSYMNSSLYAYADSDGYSSLSFNLDANTILNNDSVFITSDKSDSYLAISNSSNSISKNNKSFSSVVNVKKNNELSKHIQIDKDFKIIPIRNYKEYQISIDTDASDFYNEGDSFINSTTAPGTVINMNLNLQHTESYISIFNDLSGSPISNVKCVGDGCFDVQEIQDGVYKIRVTKGKQFKLIANNERCFIPSSDSIISNNLGTNFCMPSTEDQSGLQMAKINSKYYYYIGLYNNKNIFINTARNIYQNIDSQFVFRTVGDNTMVFLSLDNKASQQDKENINTLQSYALDDTKIKSDYAKL
ncbi:TPA: CS1-pili formation C-terminal domain-containing protein [Photobacterium damselae]